MRTRAAICLSVLSLLMSHAQAEGAEELKPIPEKLVVLTFDDSVKSHFTYVRSVLLKYKFGATFFITEGFDFPTNKRDYMSWEEIARLDSDGFEIGNHTRDHLGVNSWTNEQFAEQLEAINKRCDKYGIPRTVSFAWPGNALDAGKLAVLKKAGIRFARRGGEPEYVYDKGEGFAYEPGFDHPLLIPSAADARPKWTLDDFVRGATQAHSGRIAVIQFHGVPDKAHPWVNSSIKQFEQYMQYLADNDYKVIALRDLADYVDPAVEPSYWRAAMDDRIVSLRTKSDRTNFRPLPSKSEETTWLENMVTWHRYSVSELRAATGMSADAAQAAIEKYSRPIPERSGQIKVLPFPGGRHPRKGFLDGAIRPQRETKLSVFLPWDPTSYVVLDVPEAIRRDNERHHGLLYLAHTHVDTMWTQRGIPLKKLEWQKSNNVFQMERTLPNNVTFGTTVEYAKSSIKMDMWLTNHSDELLSNLVVQNCVMLHKAPEFYGSGVEQKIAGPFVALRSKAGDRWLITAWTPTHRAWSNPPCPCIHSDPRFPDCLPGETKRARGWLSFYEGTDIDAELQRIRRLGHL